MKKILFLITITLFLIGCGQENHFHDGKYSTTFLFYHVTAKINGNNVTIENSLTGISKFRCTQYQNRIEYNEDDGTRRVILVQEDGSLKLSDQIIFYKEPE